MKFLKINLFLLCIVNMAMANLENLPNGKFFGKGFWNTNYGDQGEYKSHIEFRDNAFSTEYIWDNGFIQLDLSFVFNKNSWFDVYHNYLQVGQGFCDNHKCQFWIEKDGEKYVETLAFYQDQFFKFGFKSNEKEVIKWEEHYSVFIDKPYFPIYPSLPVFEENPYVPGEPNVPIRPIFAENFDFITKYAGEGFWESNHGEIGSYKVIAQANSYYFSSLYIWDNYNTTSEFKLDKKDNGWFDIYFGSGNVGQGFCNEYYCQYFTFVGKARFSETFSFYKDRVEKIGYRIEDGVVYRWKEVLFNVEQNEPTYPVIPVIPVN